MGVAVGSATSDGRPLLWKTRDYFSHPDNEVYYNTSYKYNFISVVNAGDTQAWMGVNEKGFAILNAISADLPGGSSGLRNGELMRYALGTCASVADFQHLLDSTNVTGRQTQANFGVIDSTGAAAIYETGGYQYWKIDANDIGQAPNGYVLRTNFAFNGGGSSGIERYNRTVNLVSDFYSGDSLNYQSILRYQMRDFSDSNSDPVPVPYPNQWYPWTPFGYIYCYLSICRSTSVSAAVIQGVIPGELAKLSTMWTMLGQPASTITVPYWPTGDTPGNANGDPTAPLCDVANQIKSTLFDFTGESHYIDSYKLSDGSGSGLWAKTFIAENSIFAVAENMLTRWRLVTPGTNEIFMEETTFADYALSILQQAYNEILSNSQPTTLIVENSIPYRDENDIVLEDRDIVHLIWAGANEQIDPPIKNIGGADNGQPSGDDLLLGIHHVVGENVSTPGKFFFLNTVWLDHASGFPAAGDFIYLRAFNSNNLIAATYYGDAQLFEVQNLNGEIYDPLLNFGQVVQPLPILLISFQAIPGINLVTLKWKTETEVDNYGFEVERSVCGIQKSEWKKIGFIEGHGNSNSPKTYLFTDRNLAGGSKFKYRLKQIDTDGKFEYSDVVEVELIPNEFVLYQNYPNPFNASTIIRYSIPQINSIELIIFNLIGEVIRREVIENQKEGIYELSFNATGLPSGVYFYRIQAGSFVETKKMVLMK